MQFLVIGLDFPDAFPRRTAVRAEHLRIADEHFAQGLLRYGVAMLNEEKQMCGSVMVFEVESREVLDQLLSEEPYVTGKVWDKITILPAKIGPTFEKLKL